MPETARTKGSRRTVVALIFLPVIVASVTAGGLFILWRELKMTEEKPLVDEAQITSLAFVVEGARVALKKGVQGEQADFDVALQNLTHALVSIERIQSRTHDLAIQEKLAVISKLCKEALDDIGKFDRANMGMAYEKLWNAGEICTKIVSIIRLNEKERRLERLQISDRAVRIGYLGGIVAVLAVLAGILLTRRMRSSYERNIEEALESAMMNPETGLYNLGYIEMRVFEEVERARRQKKEFLILVVSSILPAKEQNRPEMAKVLKKVVRNFDLLADDGQRFLLLLFDFKLEHMDDFIGRIKTGLPHATIQSRRYPIDGESVRELLKP